MESEIIGLIKEHGLATVMLLYFMFQVKKSVDNNTKALTDMKIQITKCGGNDGRN